MRTSYSTAKRYGPAVKISVKPRFLTEEKAAELQQAIDRTVEEFQARHSETNVRMLKKLQQPEEMPQVKTKVVYRYRIKGGKMRELTISEWKCNYRLTTRRKCSEKIVGPNAGPVRHSAEMHWAAHGKGNGLAVQTSS